MTEQKALQEFYELGALRLLRVKQLPNDAAEQQCRHTIMAVSKDKSLTFFWARRVYSTQDNKQYVEATFTLPIRRVRETSVMVPPGIYLVSTKRE